MATGLSNRHTPHENSGTKPQVQQQNCFEFCLGVKPVVKKKDKHETVEIFAYDFAKSLYKELKGEEKTLERVLVEDDKQYLHIRKVEDVNKCQDYLQLRCYAVTDSEWEELNAALKSGKLSERLTDYGYSIGLGIDFEIKPNDKDSKFELIVSLESQKKYHEGKIYFCDANSRDPGKTQNGKTDTVENKQKNGGSPQSQVDDSGSKNVSQPEKEVKIQQTLPENEFYVTITFYLYVPVDPKYVENVSIKSKDVKELDGFHMENKPYGSCLWYVAVKIPPDIEQFSYRFEIHYIHVTVSADFWIWKKKDKNQESVMSEEYFHEPTDQQTCHFHIITIENYEEYARGYQEFCIHILKNVNEANLKDSTMQLESLHKREGLTLNYACKVVENIQQQLVFYRPKYLAFVAFLCMAFKNLNHIYEHNCVKPDFANSILLALQESSMDEIPSFCQKKFVFAITLLCQKLTRENFSVLFLMYYAYPFLPPNHFIAMIDSKIDLLKDPSSYGTKRMASSVLKSLYLQVCEKENVNSDQRLLEKFQTYLPLETFFHTLTELESSSVSTAEKFQELFQRSKEKIHYHCKLELQNLGKNSCMDKLLEFWMNVSSHRHIDTSQLLTVMENAILNAIVKTDGQGYGKLRNICLRDDLFVEKETQMKLLLKLAESKSVDVHYLVIIFLGQEKFRCLDCYEIDKLAHSWFDCVMKKHFRDRKTPQADYIPQLYSYLADLFGVPVIRENGELKSDLEDKACEFLQAVDIKDVIKKIKDIERFSDPVIEDMYRSHVKKLLFQSRSSKSGSKTVNSIMQEICGATTLRVNSGLTLGIVETLLELTGIACGMPNIEAFMTIINGTKFWEKVLKVEGSKKSTIKNHPLYKKAEEAIEQMIQQLTSGRIECKVLQKIEGKSDDVIDILSCKSSRRKMETILQRAFAAVKEFVNSCKLTTSVLQKCKANLPTGHLMESVVQTMEALSNFERDLFNGSVPLTELQTKSFFGSNFTEVTQHCLRLKDVIESRVFWNVSRSILDESMIIKSELEESEEDDVLTAMALLFNQEHDDGNEKLQDWIKIVNKLLHHLVDEGILSYHTSWEPHIKGEDVSLLDLHHQFDETSIINTEIEIVKHIYKRLSARSENALLMYADFEKHEEKVTAMKSALFACNMDASTDTEFNTALSSFEHLCDTSKSDEALASITLFDIYKALKTVEKVTTVLDSETTDILLTLGNSQTLMEFLQEVADEDIRNLIDAVEEHSEQYVQESTVSCLIDVKRLFQPILKKNFSTNLIEFFLAIVKSSSLSGIKNIPHKINECMENLHSLKALYKNVANRGERTKEIIENIVKKGRFHFTLADQTCYLKVEYKQDKKIVVHSEAGLNDLRSRALLIMNTEEKKRSIAKAESKAKDYLSPFVQQIDTSLGIAQILKNLQFSGHFGYTIYDKKFGQQDLSFLRDKLEEEYNLWCDVLDQCRRKFYFMNFVYSEQLQLLYQYFEKGENEKLIVPVLKYIHPDIKVSESERTFFKSVAFDDTTNPALILECLGKTIHSLLESTTAVERAFMILRTSKKLGEIVQECKLFLAALEEDSHFAVRTILALYLNTTGHLPEAHQILVCNNNTKWDEIQLLLLRCFGAFAHRSKKELFCIANVEMISSELQFMLVDKLRNLPRDLKYYLFLVCRGNERHPFLDQFRECILHPRPLTDAQMKKCFEDQWPNVFTITSDIPGLGKTEYVKQQALCKSMDVATLHISGPFEKKSLVERLSHLKIRPNSVLHVDIGMVDNPVELDSFMFELITLGCVTAGTKSFFLPTKDIYIEVANTLNQSLCNSLPTVTCFKRKNLKWEGYGNFRVSMEINSPIQVVCNYLKCVDEGMLNKVDICFTGHNTVKPLGKEQCQLILQKHFSSAGDLSFTLVNIFLNVLSDQLKKLSASIYFRTANLIAMLGEKKVHNVKSNLVKALVDVSKEFSARSIHSCRSTQAATLSPDDTKALTLVTNIRSAAEVLAMRVEGMIRWEDSNHLMVLFHQDVQTISALYRDKSKVPEHVKHLIESQINRKLEDFHLKSQTELQSVLQRLARNKPQLISDKKLKCMSENYALTPDNLLKMVLITLRIKAHVPVIIMGETGCGKTSLVRYLAEMCGITFKVLSIHAGVTEEMIVKNIMDTNAEAMKSIGDQIWMFLDEINTCDHLGIICDIVCHHKCLETILAPNIVFIAACNPYRLRDEESVFTAGLQGKVKSDELSRLVYRVHPLPETMVDFVWDFGSLSEKDEDAYICRMVRTTFPDEKISNLLSALLVASQAFVRSSEGTESCVSLRDVDRCKRLVSWFIITLKKKEGLRSRSRFVYTQPRNDTERVLTAIILALALCYHSRFSDTEIRASYRKVISEKIVKYGGYTYGIDSEKCVAEIIQKEQRDIIDRMELPEGTAKNTALQENVFVILVCILNRIPVFLVGKPGCSKSLSMQLIRSNLRGKDSRDPFFQSLPQLYCVSFQGSESSTSDGIIKVFDKAKKYQEHNKIEDVMSVVILDEIGLAEISRFNPLKVLHSLLEPENKTCPDVAVVGLSNWALDAAKMNRAIHLSRPEMDSEELYETGISISESIFLKPGKKASHIKTRYGPTSLTPEIERILKAVALAYHDYSKSQKFKNFHGLRDYYSLNKHISRMFHSMDLSDEKEVSAGLMSGLLRNFGGLPSELKSIQDIFQKHLDCHLVCDVPVLDLIQENISDRISRHLMLITSGDAVTSRVEQLLRQNEREYMVIYGSQFEEDLTDDYNYRILSRIILCMEQGLVLILKDLESIYGSLYDMLNQNYTVVGQKKNCRVALGPYSNPMCQVHDDFKCIVLVEERKLDYSDPPFLNRFEKQQFSFYDILDDTDLDIIAHLEQLIHNFCQIEHRHFTPFDAFPVYSADMLASLVLHLKTDLGDDQTTFEFAEICFKKLLFVTSPEAVVRIKRSILWNRSQKDARGILEIYLSLPLHNGFDHYISSQIDQLEKDSVSEKYMKDQQECEMDVFPENEGASEGLSHIDPNDRQTLFVIFTHSNIHINMNECIGKRNVQVEKVGSFKTEKQLLSRIQFFFESENDILVLQISAKEDLSHILLTKSAVETSSLTFKKENHLLGTKYVFMVIHLERKEVQLNSVSQLNFLSGWTMATLDSLNQPIVQLPDITEMTILEVLKSRRPLFSCIKEQLFWAFTRIHYASNRRSIASMKDLLHEMQCNDEFLNDIENVLFQYIENETDSFEAMDWQVDIACDGFALGCATTFMDALENYILKVIKNPLAMIIFKLEESNAAECYFIEDLHAKARRQFWRNLVHNSTFLQLQELKPPTGPECYNCTVPSLRMKMPFSQIIITRLEQMKTDFLDTLTKLKSYCEIEDEIPLPVFLDLASKYQDIVMLEVGELLSLDYEGKREDYIHDYCMFIVSKSASNVEDEIGETVLKWEFSNYINLTIGDFGELVTYLHTAFWTYSTTILSMLQLVEQSKVVLGNELIDMLQMKWKQKDTISSSIEEDNIDVMKSDASMFPKTHYKDGSVENVEMNDLAMDLNLSNVDSLNGDFRNSSKFTEDVEEKEMLELNDRSLLLTDKEDENLLTTTEYKEDITVTVEDIKPIVCDETHGMNKDETEELQTYDKDENMQNIDIKEPNTEPSVINTNMTIGDFTNTENLEVEEKLVEDIGDNVPCMHMGEKLLMETTEYKGDISVEDYTRPFLYDDTIPNKDDDIISEEDPISTRENLIGYICKHIFPTQELMEKITFSSWKQMLSRILPLLGNVSLELEEIYKLRFCNDLANVLIIPFKLPLDVVIEFGNLLQHSPLNSDVMFKLLMEQMHNLNTEHLVHGMKLQRIISLYIGRCLASDPESVDIMKNVLTYIAEGNMVDPKLSFLGPTIRHVIQIEMSEEDTEEENNALKNLLLYENIENSLLNDIDHCLVKLNEAGHHDSAFSTLLIDVLESIFTEDLDVENLKLVKSSSDEIIRVALEADKILYGECFNLRFLVAVAYMKAYLKIFSTLIGDYLADSEGYQVLCNNVNPLLKAGTETEMDFDRSKELLIYMLKCFSDANADMSVQKVCKSVACLLPNVGEIDWNPEFSLSSLEYSPFALHCPEGYSECITILKVQDHNDSALNKLVTTALASETNMFIFMGAVLYRYTIRKTLIAITELEKAYSEKLLVVLKEHLKQDDQYKLLEYATGKVDYGHEIYNFTSEEPEIESYVVSVLLHLSCILTAFECKGSILHKYMTKPAFKDWNEGPLYDKGKGYESLSAYLCDCSCRYVSTNVECPVCFNQSNKKEVFSKKGDTEVTSPISRLVVQFFLNGCFLNSLAFHYSKIENLQGILGLDSKDNVTIEIQGRVFSHWNRLKSLLGVNNKDLCGIFNILLFRCRNVIRSPTEDISHLEEELKEIIDETVHERFGLLQELRCKVYQTNGVSPDAVECQLDEVTAVHGTGKGMLYQPSFFRNTGTPTMENLHAELYTCNNYKLYPFLCLVLNNLQQLSVPQFISPLLRWHLATVSLASYTIRKVECKEVTVGKLITKAGDEKSKKILRKCFKQFEFAWNKLEKEFMETLKLINPDLPILNVVSNGSKVSQCVVMDSNSPLYIVLCTLVQIQNLFLDEALKLVVQNECPSINFLNTSEQSAWVSVVPLMNIEDKDVIKYEWTGDVLWYSQCETEYGHGKKIQYDFAKIEMELAHEILFRKPYIALPKAFTQILFTDELFHNSVNLMKEIRSSIPQEQLTSEIINGIQRKKEKDTTESLTLLGMVLTILKKTGGDGSSPLVEFIENWKDVILQSSFKRLLPEPEHCVKLCHIVALYEWFEELNGESVFESLEDVFRIPLPTDAKSKLEDNVSANIKLLEKLGRSLKVFVHRCLSSKDSDIDRERPLFDYICDPTFWQGGTMDGDLILVEVGQSRIKLVDVISKTLLVEHIYEAISFIQEKIEEHKEKDKRISSIAATYQASKPENAGKPKRSRTARKGFGKT